MVMSEAATQAALDAAQARHRELYDGAWQALVAQSKQKGAARFAAVDTGEGVGLIVAQATYGKVDVQLVIDGLVDPVLLVASQDGRYVNSQEWHVGEASDDEWVYYERWTAAGRVAHGYIDRVSRRLLQSG